MDLIDVNNILKRYLEGKCSDAECRYVESWLSNNGEDNDEWIQMSDADRKQWLSHLYTDVKNTIELKEQEKNNINIDTASGLRVWKLIASMAAMFVMIFGLYATWPALQDRFSPISYQELSTASGVRKLLVLDDGTRLWLNSGSSLKYPSRFKGKKREVYLQGEAYFEVAHNAKMPFIVHAGKLSTRVLGTSFNIRAYNDDPDVKVTLFAGKVEVIRENDSKETSKLVLLPKQQATYRKDAESLKKTTVSTGRISHYSAWKDGRLIFNETPVSEALKRLSLVYNVKFSLTDEKINDCTITGSFNDSQTIEEIVQSISVSIGGMFLREGDEFALIGNGCVQ